MSVETARQPAGVPVGGQFAATARTEPAVALAAAGPHWVMIEREHGGPLAVGPFDCETAAEEAMEDGVQIQGLVEDDCLDCYVGSGVLDDDVEQVTVAVDLTDDDEAPFSILVATHLPPRRVAPPVLMTVQLQEWVRDTAYPLGDEFQVDVTGLIAAMTTAQLADLKDNDGTADDLFLSAAQAGLTEKRDGPWSVQVEASLHAHRLAVDPVGTLTVLASKLDVDPADLDDAVRDVTDTMASAMVNAGDGPIEDSQDEHHGAMDSHASSVNNGGIPAQVQFLVEQVGADRTEDILRESAAATARSASVVRRRKPGR